MNKNKFDKLIPAAVIAGIMILWQLVCVIGLVPGYMLPSPVQVMRAFINDFPLLMGHARTTLIEAALGLFGGVALGFICAAVMDEFEGVRLGLYPILVITQTVPPVAIAPLLVLWFSYGIAPKVVLVILVSFFPIAVGMLEGLQSVDPDQVRLMRSMNATKLQIFRHVKLPATLGEFFSGLRIAVSYSVVGAVIAEWLGGYGGLGVYMTRVKKSFSYDKMFAVIILVSVISLVLMALIRLLQRKTMPWMNIKNRDQ